ncbi:MAG: hypothetical protein EOO39_31470 [Cytophagaceae bacterium]|nr:MAG: hypothetical protein EOO39_31470 [Cytophagaceae bacterium]
MNQRLLLFLCMLLATQAWAQTTQRLVSTTSQPLAAPSVLKTVNKASARQLAAAAITIRYVKAGATGTGSSWSDAGDLQTQINAAAAGDQVWVAGGTYKPSTSGLTDARTARFSLKEGVTLLGGFIGTAGSEGNASARMASPSSTTLSADLGTPGEQADNAYHVVFALLNPGFDVRIRALV